MQIRDILIDFDDPNVFLDEYERHLSSGWIFVPSEDEFGLGEVVEVTVDLSFCGHTARALGIVKSRISPALAEMLRRPPGAVIEFADGIDALEEMLRDTVDGLVAVAGRSRETPRGVRRHKRLEVSIRGECNQAGESAEVRTHNLSASGALLEVNGLDLEVDQRLSLSLVNPSTGELVTLSGRVVRAALPPPTSTHPAGAAPAPPSAAPAPPSQGATTPAGEPGAVSHVAVAFTEAPGVNTRKAHFLEQVRAVTHGRPMGSLSGNLSGLDLPSLLPSIASSSAGGTMEIIGDGQEGVLLFEGNQLRHAALGRVRGIKALARLLEWKEGEFSFQPTLEPDAPRADPLPIGAALRQAAAQSAALRELEGRLLSDTVVLERSSSAPACGATVSENSPDSATDDGSPASSISETEHAVLAGLERPGCPGTLLDALPQPDAEIWRAILHLLECGGLRQRD